MCKVGQKWPFFQMSAILKFDFQKREQLCFSEVNYLNYTKRPNFICGDAACKTIYICKTIYFAYAKLYVLYKVYTSDYAKTYTCAKHIVLHMQKYMFCITYEKLYILNKKRRAFHEEAPTTKITTDTAFVFCV